MKPLTNTQINTIFDLADRERENAQYEINGMAETVRSCHSPKCVAPRRIMVEKVIESYLAIEPEVSVRWIPSANRKPTDEDFSTSGHLMVLRPSNMVVACHTENLASEGKTYHWMSINDLKSIPKEPVNPEAAEENEFNTWWATLSIDPFQTHTKDVARAAWKASKQK